MTTCSIIGHILYRIAIGSPLSSRGSHSRGKLAAVEDHEPEVKREEPATILDADGLGVAAKAIRAFEERHVVTSVQLPRDRQAGCAPSDDGDLLPIRTDHIWTRTGKPQGLLSFASACESSSERFPSPIGAMPNGPDNPTLLAKKKKKKARVVSRPTANAFATPGRCPYNRRQDVRLGFG
jgi:hypothetical protein